MKHPPKPTTGERRWMVFSNGCVHGIRHSQVVVMRTRPRHSMERSSVSMFSVSRAFGLGAGLVAIALLLLFLAACQLPHAQKGGGATTMIGHGGHTNTATLAQSDNPKDASTQSVLSEQSVEYVLPEGTVIQTEGGGQRTADRGRRSEVEAVGSRGGKTTDYGPRTTGNYRPATFALLEKAMAVRMTTKDRTETTIGGAQKDTLREWAGKAANMQPVMWAGILMMTVVAGVLGYFGWWTKAGIAVGVGAGMVGLAETLPAHGGAILFGGLGVFAIVALLVLYAYYKGKLDQDHDGVPDILQKTKNERTDLGIDGRAGMFPGSATNQIQAS